MEIQLWSWCFKFTGLISISFQSIAPIHKRLNNWAWKYVPRAASVIRLFLVRAPRSIMSRIVFDSRTTLITPYASIVIVLCILHIYLFCRSFASSFIVQICRRLVKRPVNREKSFTYFPSTSSSSLITACTLFIVILRTVMYTFYKRRTYFLVECVWYKGRTCMHTILDLSIQPTFKN
jgi:hypothetical protein